METDRERRARAIAQARASVGLEGFQLPAVCEVLDELFVAGDLSNEQHTAEYLRLAGLVGRNQSKKASD